MDKLTKSERKEIRKQERQEWEEKLEKEQKTRVYKKVGIWVLTIVTIVVTLWGLIALLNTQSSPAETAIKMPPLNSKDITTGPQNAKVTLVEYADFQCPTCGIYHPILKKLLHDYNGKIRFVYRFFPLPTIHRNANNAAQAAYAAQLQGKFWQMHDMLFEHQHDWAESADAPNIFVAYAGKIGLDTNKFKQDVDADATKKFITDEVDAGTQAGVNSTPTFFLNGKQLENPRGYEEFKKVIDEKLK